MNKKFYLSVLGYFVVTMIIAVIWHLVLFHEKYQELGAFTREEPIMPFGMLAVVMQAIVFAYFYPIFNRYKGEGSPIKNGVQYCLLMGINVWTVMVFATAAKFKIEPVWEFVTYATIFQILQFVGVGVVIGLIHGRQTE